MANKIITKQSSVAGKAPTTAQIEQAELAINTADKKLYSSDGTAVFEIGDTSDAVVKTPAAGVSQSITAADPADTPLTLTGAAGQTGNLLDAGDAHIKGGTYNHFYYGDTPSLGAGVNSAWFTTEGFAFNRDAASTTRPFQALKDGNTVFVINHSGQTGVGGTPGTGAGTIGGGTAKLQVNGSGYFTGNITHSNVYAPENNSYYANAAWSAGSTKNIVDGYSSQMKFADNVSGTTAFYIGDTAPAGTPLPATPAMSLFPGNTCVINSLLKIAAAGTAKLQVNGDAYATGVWTPSDAQLKSNVQDEPIDLDALSSVKLKRYTQDGEEKVGVLAQDLQAVIPNVVQTVNLVPDDWDAAKDHTAGDKVVHGGKVYEALSDVTTGVQPDDVWTDEKTETVQVRNPAYDAKEARNTDDYPVDEFIDEEQYTPATGGWKPLGDLNSYLPQATDGTPMRESRSVSLDRMSAVSIALIGQLVEQNKALEARLTALEGAKT